MAGLFSGAANIPSRYALAVFCSGFEQNKADKGATNMIGRGSMMRLARQVVSCNKTTLFKTATRSFLTPPPVPKEIDVATGRRKAELEFERTYGEDVEYNCV